MENKSWLIFIPLIIFVALAFALPAIFGPDEGDTIYGDRFIMIENLEGDIYILADKETGVMYLSKRRGITVLMDADGKPMIWNGGESDD